MTTTKLPAVPFLDLRAPYLELREQIDAAVSRTVQSGWYLLGDELTTFELAFAEYVGAKHCIGVANGLDALHLSLTAMGIGAGDEVIVPSNTYIATWLGVTRAGATVVPVEPVERTYNLDPDRIAAAITPRTKAILPVHLYGQTADMDAIRRVADAHGLLVLEDSAQAQGARCRGTRAGALGHASAWSFYPGKNLGAFGDAGAVTTDDDAIADRLRVLRNYGSRVKYVNEVQGYNSRLDEIQAAVLGAKLPVLDEWNARRARQAARYLEALAGSPLVLPHVPDWADPVWHLFVVRTTEREELQRFLLERGVATLIHYPVPPHHQQAYASLNIPRDAYPIAERMAREVVSLPIGPHMTDEQQQRVIDALDEFTARRGGEGAAR